jgi:hypothetical protein
MEVRSLASHILMALTRTETDPEMCLAIRAGILNLALWTLVGGEGEDRIKICFELSVDLVLIIQTTCLRCKCMVGDFLQE